MNESPPDRDRESSHDLLLIVLSVLVVLALAAGGLLLFGLRPSTIQVEYEEEDSPSSPHPVPNVSKSPFDDESTTNSPVPQPPAVKVEPPSDEQLADSAKQAVLKKLKLPANADNVAWAEPEFSKNDDGTFSVTGVLTADGMSRKWSCKLRAEIVAGKSSLVASDVTLE